MRETLELSKSCERRTAEECSLLGSFDPESRKQFSLGGAFGELSASSLDRLMIKIKTACRKLTANHLEEQFYLGRDSDAQIVYGMSKQDFQKFAEKIIREARKNSRRELARASDFPLSKISALLNDQLKPNAQALLKIHDAIKALEKETDESKSIISGAREMSLKLGMRKFAAQAGIDSANLNKILMGKRHPSAE